VTNVGDVKHAVGFNDGGTRYDASDDSVADPITIQLQLPPGVTTRLDHATAPFAQLQATAFYDNWDCGPDLFVAGLSSLTCTLIPDIHSGGAAFRGEPGPGQMNRLFVYVSIDPDATGTLDAQATVSGGGAAPVTVTESVPVGPNPTDFAIEPDTFAFDAFDETGMPERQAGSHPFRATTSFDVSLVNAQIEDFAGNPKTGVKPVENVRSMEVDLPNGFLGDPTAVAQCTIKEFEGNENSLGTNCPPDSQIGTIDLAISPIGGLQYPSPTPHLAVYNLVPPKGALADVAFSAFGSPVHILAYLDPVDHSIRTKLVAINETLVLHHQRLNLWGVPADAVHDADRWSQRIFCEVVQGGACNAGEYKIGWGEVSGLSRKPFLTLPMECGVPRTATLSGVDTWQNPGVFEGPLSSSAIEMEGCEKLVFKPAISVQGSSPVPDAPSGLEVKVTTPQSEDPDLLGTPPLKKAVVTLPEGMSINPASADGLVACTDDQLRLGTNLGLKPGEPSCPDASKIGSVTAVSPALEDPIEGGLYVRPQNSSDPQSGEMFRLALVLRSEERGLIVKLPGSAKADPSTGRLETTFDDSPQLPVERISLRLKGGDRAPLANSPSCADRSAAAVLSSWGGQASSLIDEIALDCPSAAGFSPGFRAGSTSPIGGAFSPFVARMTRGQGERYLSGVRMEMPKGVLAKLKGVELCPDAVAGDGTPDVCPAGSRVGTATVAAGSGKPFTLRGPVYLTGPYKGAPYGLSVQVAAKAGPYDLGMVKVRNALHVDPETAQASVVSDRLPQIVKGVPVRLRSVNVDVDRPGFAINPTSCAEKQVGATLTSIDGAIRRASSRFQVGDCSALGFKPRLGMRLVGKRQMRSGGHPVLRAQLTQGEGQANVKAAKVTLPPNLVLDSRNSVDPKLLCGYDAALKADCPASSIIGMASLRTPLLNRPLSGPVHFVQGIRFENGNRIRTLPTLLIKLRGEVSINLRSTTNTDSKDRLVSTFPSVPDARAGKFNLQINGGRKGILVVTENRRGRINLCNKKQTALVETDGHNGKRADYPIRVKTPCAKKRKR
jgi:hypothetical protein